VLFSGLVLQDLTFVHIGNPDRLPDGCVNFTKCWQMFNILDHMRRFGKWYTAPTDFRLIAFTADHIDNFNNMLLSGFKCSLKSYFYKLSFTTWSWTVSASAVRFF